MKRRSFLTMTSFIGASIAMLASGVRLTRAATGAYPPEAGDMTYEVVKTPDEWREILTGAQFNVLREEGTERAFTSPLNDEKREGTFHCAGCDLPVYSSETKFMSGTGWPSFYDNIEDAVRTKEDNTLFTTRTEVHCRRCEGHLGHIFEDGPEPTGLRHCLNGVALTFQSASSSS